MSTIKMSPSAGCDRWKGFFHPLYVVCICNFAFVYGAWSKVARKHPVAMFK